MRGGAEETASAPAWARCTLWTLDGLDNLEPATVTKALEDGSRDVRSSAVRLGNAGSVKQSSIQAAVLKHADDSDWSVREQVAHRSACCHRAREARSLRARSARRRSSRHGRRVERHRGSEAIVLDKLMQSTAQTPERDAAITMLAGTIVRGGRTRRFRTCSRLADETARRGGVRRFFAALKWPCSAQRCRDRRADDGARRRCRTACTCPGGRAGPSGAYAFSGRPRQAAGAEARIVRLVASRLRCRGYRRSECAAASVLARISGLAKPGVAAALPPLTAESSSGSTRQQVYRNICQACHQPDGRGQDKIAPSLVGSTLALARRFRSDLINGRKGRLD